MENEALSTKVEKRDLKEMESELAVTIERQRVEKMEVIKRTLVNKVSFNLLNHYLLT